jgi:hypothetical protein
MSDLFKNIVEEKVMPARDVIAGCLGYIADPFENYQRGALREAQGSLNKALDIFCDGAFALTDDAEKLADVEVRKHIAAAVQALGDAIDHAHRDGFTEERDEVRACEQAFNILTAKGAAA